MQQTDADRSDFSNFQPPDNSGERGTKRKIVFWIAIGILVWEIVLGFGDFIANHDSRRQLIIIASVVIFVGFWMTMLRVRRPDEAELETKLKISNNDSRIPSPLTPLPQGEREAL